MALHLVFVTTVFIAEKIRSDPADWAGIAKISKAAQHKFGVDFFKVSQKFRGFEF